MKVRVIPERLSLENGDSLFYLGEKRTLTVIREDRTRAKVKCLMGRLIMWVPYEADYSYKKEQLEKWYRREAGEVFHAKALEYAAVLHVDFKDIRVKDQKSRWGSCSSNKNMNFNWRILMAPEPVCDYVIIHELCHLVHMNHSTDFWNLVESICPGYREYKRWLKEHGEDLYLF